MLLSTRPWCPDACLPLTRWAPLPRLTRQGLVTPLEQEIVAQQRSAEYRSFGTVAALLGYVADMIPCAGAVLELGNSVGAALWAEELEKKGGRMFRHSL